MSRRGFTLVELVVVMAIIAALIALLLPGIQLVRESSRRTRCQAKLQQIGIAMHNYHNSHHCFPPGWFNSECPKTIAVDVGDWGGFVMVLPGLDEQTIFNAINFALPASDAAKTTLVQKELSQFFCPSNRSKGIEEVLGSGHQFACADYRFNHAAAEMDDEADVRYVSGRSNGFAQCSRPIVQTQISDGLSNTIAVGENLQGHWATGKSCCIITRAGAGIGHDLQESPPYTWTSMHEDGAMFLFADGSARLVADTVTDEVLHALMTIAGKEPLGDSDY